MTLKQATGGRPGQAKPKQPQQPQRPPGQMPRPPTAKPLGLGLGLNPQQRGAFQQAAQQQGGMGSAQWLGNHPGVQKQIANMQPGQRGNAVQNFMQTGQGRPIGGPQKQPMGQSPYANTGGPLGNMAATMPQPPPQQPPMQQSPQYAQGSGQQGPSFGAGGPYGGASMGGPWGNPNFGFGGGNGYGQDSGYSLGGQGGGYGNAMQQGPDGSFSHAGAGWGQPGQGGLGSSGGFQDQARQSRANAGMNDVFGGQGGGGQQGGAQNQLASLYDQGGGGQGQMGYGTSQTMPYNQLPTRPGMGSGYGQNMNSNFQPQGNSMQQLSPQMQQILQRRGYGGAMGGIQQAGGGGGGGFQPGGLGNMQAGIRRGNVGGGYM